MDELNSLSFERMQCLFEFTNLAIQLENQLASVRCAMSKARTLRGVVLSTLFNIDAQTLVPTARVICEGDTFKLVDEISHDGDAGVEKVHIRIACFSLALNCPSKCTTLIF
ncbi:unnamed protein product [Strongylus vulgaris]|uniref:Uncharacterized protein n=1 Tax=Strongylus vulgaris TaxID=40348 RepID=A0A3P7KC70_STRVU|nr:unnamed protein product [Strongylus vulgaris]